MRIIRFILIVVICISCFVGGALFFLVTYPPFSLEQAISFHRTSATVVLDDHNKEWARFQLDQRKPITFKALPKHLIDAFLAAEDNQFFRHSGLSWRGIARSLIINFTQRRFAQGASTITQQLVKILFFSHNKTILRKIKEQITALLIECSYTKEQIFEAYVNVIYFGGGTYGIQAASQRFWDKTINELTIAQSAMLAGMIQSPNNFCPLYPENHERCITRRNAVLKRMHDHNFISKDEYECAINEKLTIAYDKEEPLAQHARELIRQQAEALVGRELLYSGGLIIKTTLNLDHQSHAERLFMQHITAFKKRHATVPLDGGLLTLECATGAVKALVGGANFKESKLNRTKRCRQIGSLIKPFIYYTGIPLGKLLSDVEIDEPLTTIAGWDPQNVNKRFLGPMTRAHALIVSNNIVAIKTFLAIGADHVINLLERLHLPGPFIPYPSLALGCTEASLFEITSAYATLATEGTYHKPYLIEWIKDGYGKKIWKHVLVEEQVLSFSITSHIVHILKQVPLYIAQRIKKTWINDECIGKTGTTNDARSCWYIGGTKKYMTGIYLGCDNNESLNGIASATLNAAPLWLDLYKTLPREQEVFRIDPQLKYITINRFTGKLTDAHDPAAIKLLT